MFLFLRPRDSAVKDAQPMDPTRPEESWLEAKDFSASNSVSIVLGEKESGNGLEHLATERDGLTAVGTVSGLRCRYLNLPPITGRGEPRQNGFFYFFIDTSFKQEGTNSVRIEVEYYNEKRGSLGLQYDARVKVKSMRSIYTRAGPSIALDGAKEWETAVFHIRDGAFEGTQNGGADFRLEVAPPELYVRRVTVTREKDDESNLRAAQ